MAYMNERGDERFLGGDTTETAAELFERGDFKRALIYALRVIKVYPLDPLPYVIAGDAMQRLGSRDIKEIAGIEGDFFGQRHLMKSGTGHRPTSRQVCLCSATDES